MIFRRGADHGWTANVDVFDGFIPVRALGDRRLERIEIDDEEIDRLDPMRQHGRLMFRIFADCQQAAMHFRMQGLDPSVHHFWKTGDVRHVEDRQACVGERLARAAG